MKKISKPLAVLFTIAAAGARIGVAAGEAKPATLAPAPAVPWKAVAASGQVDARPPSTLDEWRKLVRGELLAPQTTVRTGKKGRATLARNGSVLIVDRDSRIDLPSVTDRSPESSVVQDHGRVVYKIEKRDSRHFQVVTPYLVAGVKGTTFIVTVEDGNASVTVAEGVVEVTSATTGETTDVHAGESAIVGRDPESRMGLVSSRSGERATEKGRSESEGRAREDATRMASLLDSSLPTSEPGVTDPTRSAADLPVPAIEPVKDDLGSLAGDVMQGRDAGRELDLDPLRDPITSLPVDSVLDPVGTGHGNDRPDRSGPGRSGSDTIGPGGASTGSSGPGGSH